jgi:hypothetical protein
MNSQNQNQNKDIKNVNYSSNSKELSLSSPAKFSNSSSNKNRRVKQIENILSSKLINFSELKKQSWKGIPFGKKRIKIFLKLQKIIKNFEKF